MSYDTTPHPSFLRGLQEQPWTVVGAIKELVDNSFGPARGNANNVYIHYDSSRRLLSVLDDGQGMEEVGRLFRLGTTPVRAPGDIGNYGFGGTYAVLWLDDQVTITTLRKGKVQKAVMNWARQLESDHFFPVSDEWSTATVANTPLPLYELGHGTLITLKLRPKRKLRPTWAVKELIETYAPGLRKGKRISWSTTGHAPMELAAVPIRTDPKRTIHFDLHIVPPDDPQQVLSAHGEIGVADQISHEDSVIKVGYGFRVIKETRDCFSSPDGSEKFLGTGVTGYLDLGEGWQSRLTTQKNAFSDEPLWDALMEHVFEKIKPLLKELEEDKLWVALEGIGADLELMLDGDFKVDVLRQLKKPAIDVPSYPPNDPPKYQWKSGENPPEPKPADPEGEKQEEKPATPRIEIWPVGDADLDGYLSLTKVFPDNIVAVCVNKDHWTVQEALKAKPINRMALHYLVTADLAHTLSHDKDLAHRLLRPEIRRQLEKIDLKPPDEETLESKKQRALHRLFMDKIRTVGDAA